ncbi:MAG TPA: cysteine desulfurase-like protein [Herpetosiphonaceae bacterium]
MTPIDLSPYRAQFPALRLCQDDTPLVFFDNPGGTQVPESVADAMRRYLLTSNANVHGPFLTSRRTDEVLAEAHAAMADLLNAASPDEIIFGQNMTSLTFAMSRSLGRDLQPGDEIVVTALDHDANIAPWLALADRGARIHCVDVNPAGCTLDYEQMASLISERTRIVAVGLASNAVGTINDVRRVVEMARAVGALVFVDAVQGVPHLPVDVQDLGCDFLACSAYKFFGPHQGILWGRREHLERLHAYKVRPAPNELPGKWETGTQSHEGQAGTLAAVEYLAGIGRDHAACYQAETAGLSGRRRDLRAAMLAIRDYERQLSRHFLEQMSCVPDVSLYGIDDLERVAERVPTFAVTLPGYTPQQLSAALAERGFATWAGHYYALALVERLGTHETGGMLRIGAAHYNTAAEIDGMLAALSEIAAGT